MSRWGTRRGDGLSGYQSGYSPPLGPLEPFNHRTRVRQLISREMKRRYKREGHLGLYQHEVLSEASRRDNSRNGKGIGTSWVNGPMPVPPAHLTTDDEGS
jgi:hypothetical protein